MQLESKRIFFATSSIPESEDDWKSVFIADMLKAFSLSFHEIIYWGPQGLTPKNVINSVRVSHQYYFRKLLDKGGIAKLLRQGSLFEKLFYPVFLLTSIRQSAKQYSREFDVYFINWLQNSITLPNDGKDLVITVLGTDLGLLKKPLMKALLRRVFKQHKTFLLPNAHWMSEELNNAFGDLAEILPLQLGIRDDWFELTKRESSLWISVSRVTEQKVNKLLDLGSSFFKGKEKLILIGPNQENINLPEWIEMKGATTLDELKDYWYPKAKALIFLSEHNEGRPQTIIEAMAAGVPVICLDKPLYREFITSGENGYLVKNSEDLKYALNKLKESNHNESISINSRSTIKNTVGGWNEYAKKVMAIVE